MRQTVNIYIHRPAAEGGETDTRFREATRREYDERQIEFWIPDTKSWCALLYPCVFEDWIKLGTIWRILGSDAPSDHLQALADQEMTKCEA